MACWREDAMGKMVYNEDLLEMGTLKDAEGLPHMLHFAGVPEEGAEDGNHVPSGSTEAS